MFSIFDTRSLFSFITSFSTSARCLGTLHSDVLRCGIVWIGSRLWRLGLSISVGGEEGDIGI
jgi:hypothetical protein